MIGAFQPKMVRISARDADDGNVSSTGPREHRRLARELDRACAEVGRDPASISRSWCGGCAVAPTRAEAERRADGRCSPDEEDD
jgi:alkanesulfonate monooxygenase SsuD/methylene tetrahydromethanopterin reductase-like flavin-dependent oxidoreductase (luciferase family)